MFSQSITETLFDIPLCLCTREDGIKIIEGIIGEGKPGLVVLANAHTFNLAYENRDYRGVLKRARAVFRDGVGVEWALARKGLPAHHNFAGTDFIPYFCKSTAGSGYRVYLLGARPGICELAARELESIAPGMIIAGYHHGYFSEHETEEIVARINRSQARILLVAMGNPKQEVWISENLERLTVPACIGVGALFDHLSGRLPRAPEWMLRAKIEWIYRLLTEPGRLWKRYLMGNPKFMVRVYRELGKEKAGKTKFNEQNH